jgi:hypothetical protein
VHRSHRCIGMVYPGTSFIGDNGAFLCIPMKIGVKFEHCAQPRLCSRGAPVATSTARCQSDNCAGIAGYQ